MMRVTIFAAVAVGLLAVGCDSPETGQANTPIVVRSQAQDQMHELSDLNRAIALRRAIYDAGFSCQRVDESGYVQEYGNLSMWTASCSDGRKWAVFIAPDGTAQLRRCETMEELNLPRCVITGQRQQVDGPSEQQAEQQSNSDAN